MSASPSHPCTSDARASTSNLRDDIDKLDARIRGVEETAGHAVRAARKASDDTVQLREDV